MWTELEFKGTKYYCTESGLIRGGSGSLLLQREDEDGYLRVRLTDATKVCKDKRVAKLVHRLIYQAFNPSVSMVGLTINHMDGDKQNNWLYNLELVTRAENNYHAYRTGLKDNKGEKNGKARFMNEDILLMRGLFERGWSQSQLAERFKTTQPRISEIITGRTWKHI